MKWGETVSVINARYGPFGIIDTDSVISRSLRLYGEWAQLEIDLLSLFICSGDVVVDVGAFIGTHSIPFSAMVGPTGRVLAFEPRAAFASILKENAQRANCTNVEVSERGVGAVRESINVRGVELTHTENVGASTLGPSDQDGGGETVVIIPLDSLKLARADFVKIDDEGMESDVLRGAEK